MDYIVLYICNFIDDKTKVPLLSITTRTHRSKKKIFYDEQILITLIKHLWYFDRFINVVVSKTAYQIVLHI